jgi:quercetin dioxygenase-like cupin family protein
MMKLNYVMLISISTVGLLAPAIAQEGIKRTPLGTLDFPPGYQTVKGYAEIAKGTCSGRHTHPGIETSYLLEGELILKVDGQPDKHVKAGDPVEIPAGIVHDGCATAGSAAKVLTVHVVEKGKPLGSPAP